MPKNEDKPTGNYETTMRIKVESSKKLSCISRDLDMTKKETMAMLINIGYRLNTEMKGYIKLLNDPRLKMKLYFDEDERQAITF